LAKVLEILTIRIDHRSDGLLSEIQVILGVEIAAFLENFIKEKQIVL
jgi:hypothetical protein